MIRISVLLALTAQFAGGVRLVKRREDAAKPLSVIVLTMKHMVMKSHIVASLAELGETEQRNNIWAVRITGAGYTKSTGKKLLFTFNLVPKLTSGDDAGVYVAEQMIEKAVGNSSWLSNTQVVIVPVANPDGFAHPEQNGGLTNNRRSGGCDGVVLNRNFEKGWDEKAWCAGPRASSEPESKALAAEITDSTSVLINVMGNSSSDVSIGYSCAGCGRPDGRVLMELFRLSSTMTRAMSKVNSVRHRTKYRNTGESGSMADYALSQGVLAAEVHTQSKEECYAGLLAAIR